MRLWNSHISFCQEHIEHSLEEVEGVKERTFHQVGE